VDIATAHPTALGQLLLAFADGDIRDRLIADELSSSRPAVSISRERVEVSLSVTRLSGVAIARTGKFGEALGVAVPVQVDGRVLAGLEVEVRDFNEAESVLADLRVASRRIAGGTPDPV
jgi:DNA-binding IclR family transcriptional regulator